jgi:hypothetical protein
LAVESDGKYYAYILIINDDDILVCSTNPQKIMGTLAGIYLFKVDPKTKAKYKPPDSYLGANTGTYNIPSSLAG